ncbi:MAG: ABC transporter ATP-binding protein [Opitutaceae bacterium]|nr:ABC transporter ATP-binding protein [Opitutaceae bacterium]
MNAIEVEGLAKDFRPAWHGPRVRALDGVTLQVREGEIMGLLGPNGSGKSTLLKIILGLLAPTAGVCRVFGVPSDLVAARLGVGYLPEAPDFCPQLTGFELVCYHARLGGAARRGLQERAGAVIAQAGLRNAMHRRVGTYSQGMRQRLGLALVLILEPRLVILDEPASGMDPGGVEEVGKLIKRLKAQGRTVLFSSHLLGQVEELCDRVVLLHRGRIVRQGSVDALTQRKRQVALLVDPLPDPGIEELDSWLRAHGSSLRGVETPRIGLDRVFRETVGDRNGGGNTPS